MKINLLNEILGVLSSFDFRHKTQNDFGHSVPFLCHPRKVNHKIILGTSLMMIRSIRFFKIWLRILCSIWSGRWYPISTMPSANAQVHSEIRHARLSATEEEKRLNSSKQMRLNGGFLRVTIEPFPFYARMQFNHAIFYSGFCIHSTGKKLEPKPICSTKRRWSNWKWNKKFITSPARIRIMFTGQNESETLSI